MRNVSTEFVRQSPRGIAVSGWVRQRPGGRRYRVLLVPKSVAERLYRSPVVRADCTQATSRALERSLRAGRSPRRNGGNPPGGGALRAVALLRHVPEMPKNSWQPETMSGGPRHLDAPGEPCAVRSTALGYLTWWGYFASRMTSGTKLSRLQSAADRHGDDTRQRRAACPAGARTVEPGSERTPGASHTRISKPVRGFRRFTSGGRRGAGRPGTPLRRRQEAGGHGRGTPPLDSWRRTP